jgi:hypothetical protein
LKARDGPTRKYNSIAKDGQLPHESTQREFKERWTDITKRIYSAHSGLPHPFVSLQIDWLNFSIDWFADDADLAFQSQLQHCHNFVNQIRQAIGLSSTLSNDEIKLFDFIQDLCEQTEKIRQKRDKIFSKLQERFGKSKKLEGPLRVAAQFRTLFAGDAEQFYFGFARKALQSGIFATESPPPKSGRPDRLHVVDLPSIEEIPYKMMAVGGLLDAKTTFAFRCLLF